MGTFTVTADQLADVAANGLLWIDQDVQRGIRPDLQTSPPRELNLANGYPDATKYIFDGDNADNIVEKLLQGDKVFLNPLIWNLRPGTFEAYWSESKNSLYIYSGKVYLPDSHHRADLYPGQGIADPNSSLSLEGAVAHELTRWHR